MYEVLTVAHLLEAQRRWGVLKGWAEVRLKYLPFVGYAVRDENGDLAGVGYVAWIGPRFGGKAVGCFHITEAYRANPRSRWVHRRALEVLQIVHSECPVIFAEADENIPKSREFLQRLGFVEQNGEWVRYDVCDTAGDASRIVPAVECVAGN